jgi:hypothetical protein
MKFAGFGQPIVSLEHALASAVAETSHPPVMVIASSFLREILPRVRKLGWRGEVLDLSGNHV